MYKKIINNLNIDLIAKEPVSRVREKLDYVKIETTINLKDMSTPLGLLQDKHTIKRHKFKLLKLFGQEPKFIKSRTSVAEWKLRKNMIIGCYITLRENEHIDRFFKLWVLSSQVRENIFQSFNKYGQRGLTSEGIEWFILVNDWPLTDFISRPTVVNSFKGQYEKINEELRDLKLMGLGLNLHIQWKTDIQQSFKFSYLLFINPTKQ